jgi:hypothetical protein
MQYQSLLYCSCYVSVPGASSELLWAGDETQAYPCRVPQCIYNCKCERRFQMVLLVSFILLMSHYSENYKVVRFILM